MKTQRWDIYSNLSEAGCQDGLSVGLMTHEYTPDG